MSETTPDVSKDARERVVDEIIDRASAAGDVRERVAREVFTLDADWRREYWDQFRRDFPRQAQAYYDTADRICALLRTPRGEREAELVAWLCEARDFRGRWQLDGVTLHDASAEAWAAADPANRRAVPLYRSARREE